MRVPRVIANLEPSDRVGFITPDAVSTDQARYAEQLRSELRLALGGIDDLSITNVTATEIKSAYGRVSATAKKKCLQLLVSYHPPETSDEFSFQKLKPLDFFPFL